MLTVVILFRPLSTYCGFYTTKSFCIFCHVHTFYFLIRYRCICILCSDVYIKPSWRNNQVLSANNRLLQIYQWAKHQFPPQKSRITHTVYIVYSLYTCCTVRQIVECNCSVMVAKHNYPVMTNHSCCGHCTKLIFQWNAHWIMS